MVMKQQQIRNILDHQARQIGARDVIDVVRSRQARSRPEPLVNNPSRSTNARRIIMFAPINAPAGFPCGAGDVFL